MEMTKRYMLDTNAIIYMLNGRLASPLPDGHYSVSIITEIELLSFPDLSQGEEQQIRVLLREFQTIPLTESVSAKTIQLRRNNKKLKLPDAVIAASAIQQQAVLLTNDQIFSAIDGLSYQTLQLVSGHSEP